MSWDINQVMLVGRLTQDPELRYGQSGNAYSTLSLAVGGGSRQEGQEDEVSYFRIRSFGRQAEICNQYLSKGSQIGVLGRLKQNRWQDQNGQNRSVVEIIASRIQFLGSPSGKKKEESSSYEGKEGEDSFSSSFSTGISSSETESKGIKEDLSFSEEDDEIPF